MTIWCSWKVSLSKSQPRMAFLSGFTVVLEKNLIFYSSGAKGPLCPVLTSFPGHWVHRPTQSGSNKKKLKFSCCWSLCVTAYLLGRVSWRSVHSSKSMLPVSSHLCPELAQKWHHFLLVGERGVTPLHPSNLCLLKAPVTEVSECQGYVAILVSLVHCYSNFIVALRYCRVLYTFCLPW